MDNTIKALKEHLPELVAIYDECKTVYSREVSMGHQPKKAGAILTLFYHLIRDIRNYG